jgi:hypothetical protein
MVCIKYWKTISKPFPAYIFGVGAENIDKEKKKSILCIAFYIKTTLVLDQQLADQGAFGVLKATYDDKWESYNRGWTSKMELGFQSQINTKKRFSKY